MDQNNAQVLFFQQIKTLLPPHISMADEIAKVLEMSTDSAYRRIRGEKSISFEEIRKLGVYYKISIDQFLQLHSNGFIFTGGLAYTQENFVEQYLNNMKNQFEFMLSFDNLHIYFLPNDIPPFAYFQFPELAAFTLFYYQKSLLQFPEMKAQKFSVKDISDSQVHLGKKIQESYNRIPTTEIWGIDIINSILKHISFYRDTNVFESTDDIDCIYKRLEELLSHVEMQAEKGFKFNYGEMPGDKSASFAMFHNDLLSGDNTVLAEVGDTRIAYINHNLINFMFTRDEGFTAHTLNTFQNAIRKSTQISLVGEKTRAAFFDQLRKRVLAHKESNNR